MRGLLLADEELGNAWVSDAMSASPAAGEQAGSGEDEHALAHRVTGGRLRLSGCVERLDDRELAGAWFSRGGQPRSP